MTCQQGLQFFPDPAAAVAEMHRVLRPGGRTGIAVWRGIEECPFWAAVEVAAAEVLDAERAALIRAPFSWPGEEALVNVLDQAGFVDIVVSTHGVVMHFEGGIRQALTSLVTTPLNPHLATLDADGYEAFVQGATRALGLTQRPEDPLDTPARTGRRLRATGSTPPGFGAAGSARFGGSTST